VPDAFFFFIFHLSSLERIGFIMRQPLSHSEVAAAVEHRRPSRVPMSIHMWNGYDPKTEIGQRVREIQEAYPDDLFRVGPRMPNHWDDRSDPNHVPGCSWLNEPPPPPSADPHAMDSNAGIRDWSQLDAILDAWPDPSIPQVTAGLAEHIAQHAAGRYTGIHWWFLLYERLWSLRGMENILCDFYEHPREVHRLMDALTDFYCAIIRRCAKELPLDFIISSDDIGMQTGPMFSPAIFREFFRGRYAKMIRTAHDCNLHFWLHACGNIEPFLADFVAMGLDVIHPIQKYTMDERAIAARYGGKLAFWTGMDVQQILPRGTPDDVRREVRFMIDTYDRPDGGCIITAGNGIGADVPMENLLAFYDESYEYGIEHRRRLL